MALDAFQALAAANRPPAPSPRTQGDGAAPNGTLIIAGATGALGNELLRRLAGTHRYAHTRVLAREPMQDGLRGVETVQEYNVLARSFPTNLTAKVMGYQPKPNFTVQNLSLIHI